MLYKGLIFSMLFFMLQCTTPSKNAEKNFENNVQIVFKSIESQSTSLLKDITFVKLETNDENLLGNINQIEVFDELIYILCDSGLYIFDLLGNFIRSIRCTGNGPGEFLSPYSFWIDEDGFIFVLDRQLNRLLKYNLQNLDFIESIIMPYESPLAFAKMPKENLFVYYYPLRPSRGIEEKQVFIADKSGKVISELYVGDESGKILHGNSSNFYTQGAKLKFYPYFSNKIFAVETDTLHNIYTLSFKDNNFPDQDIFRKYDNSGDIMKEILFGDHKWIRLIYIYETESHLVVKYYIERDLYISIWNKSSDETINFKYDNVIDDLGIGGKFPLPIGVYNNQIIGIINPYDLINEEVENIELKKLIGDISEEDNPILCFYSIR